MQLYFSVNVWCALSSAFPRIKRLWMLSFTVTAVHNQLHMNVRIKCTWRINALWITVRCAAECKPLCCWLRQLYWLKYKRIYCSMHNMDDWKHGWSTSTLSTHSEGWGLEDQNCHHFVGRVSRTMMWTLCYHMNRYFWLTKQSKCQQCQFLFYEGKVVLDLLSTRWPAWNLCILREQGMFVHVPTSDVPVGFTVSERCATYMQWQ